MAAQYNAYKVTHLTSGKAYIGITSRSVQKRWLHHVSHAVPGKAIGRLALAICKHGPSAFSVEHIASAFDWPSLCELERILITQEGTFTRGYNATRGGEGMLGFRHSEEAKARIAAAKIGKARPVEFCEQQSRARKGKPLSERQMAGIRARCPVWTAESRTECAERARNRVWTAESKTKLAASKTGQRHSDEVRAKIRAKALGRIISAETRAKLSAVFAGRVMTSQHRARLSQAAFARAARERAQKEMGGG